VYRRGGGSDLRVGTPFGAAEDDHVVGGAGRRSAAENYLIRRGFAVPRPVTETDGGGRFDTNWDGVRLTTAGFQAYWRALQLGERRV
jgi:hypothetical protein